VNPRRGGLVQFGNLRQLGGQPSSGGSSLGFSQFWDSTKYYPALDLGQLAGTGVSTVPYGVAEAANFIYAWPVTFQRAGTITALAQQVGNNNAHVWIGVYDSAANAPQLPVNRLFDVEKISPGFNQPVVASGLNIACTAGRTYWFAQVWGTGAGGGSINFTPNAVRPWLGTDYDGVTAGAVTIAQISAIKHAFTYAQLPATFPSSPTYWKSNQAVLPILMFKYTPA